MPSVPRILFVSPETPCPTGTGGRVRSWHVLRGLAQQYAVTLLVLNHDYVAMDAELRRFCSQVFRPLGKLAPACPPPRWRSLLKTVGVLAFPWQRNWEVLAAYAGQHCGGPPHQDSHRSTRLVSALLSLEIRLVARRYTPPPMLALYLQNTARSLGPDTVSRLASERYDVLWIEHSICHPAARQLLPSGQRPLRVCNAHNVEFLLQERCAALARSPAEAQWTALQSELVRRIESDAFQSCDLTLACSKDDAALIAQLAPQASLLTVPNGVDTGYFRPSPGSHPAPAPTLVFTAGFLYQANCDAVGWFIAEIFPRVRAAVPDCQFIFAGLAAQAAFNRLSVKPDGVHCVSDPADIRPQFESAWVFVVPLRAGGGTRLKILEAMAMERPVVSTRVGAEGVPYKDGEHLLLADSAEEFARAAIRLLQSRELREKLVANAALFARQHYEWSTLMEMTRSKLDTMISAVGRQGNGL